MTTGVSFLGQSTAQIARLQQQKLLLSDLQRQMTTQKKYETMSGLGFESLNVQRFRMEASRLQTYLDNIDTATTRINVMSEAMERAADLGRDLISAITVNPIGGEVDIGTIRTIAQNGLEFLQSLVNTDIGGRYLFAGSAAQTQPFASGPLLDTTYQAEIVNWLNGTNTTAQLLTNSNGFSPTQLGFDAALSSAGEVSLRIDDTTEIDYTVLGNANGFEDLMRALAFAANIEIPDPATDVPTLADFTTALNDIVTVARRGVASMDDAAANLGSKFTLIKSIQETHRQDMATYQSLTDREENVDTTEVVAKIQILQTQLQASYQVTGIINQLSLVNFL